MRRVPWWAVLPAITAPILLIGGWTLAAAVQPSPFDPVVRTISELAARDTPHRWVMTVALVGVGLSHLLTAFALAPAATAGRIMHGLGGLATVMVAAFPLPAGGGTSPWHTTAAAIAFVSLALWPAFAWAPPSSQPGSPLTGVSAPYPEAPRVRRARRGRTFLGPRVSAAATSVLVLTLGWFFTELLLGSERVGLAERVAAGAQALWPLAAVLLARRVPRSAPQMTGGHG